ncbi:MAG: sarcosine oxidase subunit gamma family protein [Rhodospirillales bacterium]
MAEPRRIGPLDHVAPADSANQAALRALPPAAQFIFRGPPDAVARAGDGFGVPLPRDACRAATSDDRAALWLGPDEFLLLAPTGQEASIAAAIAASLGTVPHALVSVGHRNTALEAAGAGAPRMLNAGCPLNLGEAEFPVGMCTRTVLAKAPVVLWRREADTFYVSAWRSFAPYVWDFLIEARARL